jgi:hypothetical protein
MLEDEKTSGMRKMNMARLSLEPCPNDYKCEGCDIEKKFLKDIRSTLAQFRNRFHHKV